MSESLEAAKKLSRSRTALYLCLMMIIIILIITIVTDIKTRQIEKNAFTQYPHISVFSII